MVAPIPGSLALLKRVVVGLRYAEITDLIGARVLVTRPDLAHAEVARAFAAHLPSRTSPIPGSDPQATAAKYGLLDLEFATDLRPEGLPRLRGEALRSLSLQVAPDEANENSEEALYCLELLEEEIAEPRCIVRVFLDAESDERSTATRFQHAVESLPSSFWPRYFVVRDACTTNAPTLWLEKHFYL